MYSLMSKRRKAMPRTSASCLATSVLPTPVGPVSRKLPTGFCGVAQAGAGDLDGADQALDGLVLAEDDLLELLFEPLELLALVALHLAGGDLRHHREHLLEVGDGDSLAAAQGDGRAGLVEEVDGLVRQPAVAQVAVEAMSAAERMAEPGVAHAVVLLVALAEPLEDLDRLLRRGLVDLDLLEAAGEGLVALEGLAELLPGGGADAAQGAVLEGGLEQVRGVHGAVAGAAGADHGVDLVDEQDRAAVLRARAASTAFKRFSKSPR